MASLLDLDDYGLQADATRQAADDDMLPREAQSITWGGAKSLFEGQKTAQNLAAARDIWHSYSAGRISADDARNQIADQFAPRGLALPPWYQGAKDLLSAPELGGLPSQRVGSGAGGGDAGTPAGLAAPSGGAGVPAGMGSPDLSGIRAATRLLPPPGYADGGLIQGGPPSDDGPVTGLVPPTLDADEDSLTAPLPQGGFVLPAASMSLLGGGSLLRGARHLDQRLPPPARLPAAPSLLGRVSPGEYVVHPHQLRALRGLLG